MIPAWSSRGIHIELQTGFIFNFINSQLRLNQIMSSEAPGWIHHILNSFQLLTASLGSAGWLAAMEDHQSLVFIWYC